MKKFIIPCFLASLLSFFLLFPKETLDASRQGLLLWFDTLVPSLLPFLIISQLILKTEASTYIERILSPLFQRIFHCSTNGACCILFGFLCGYPVGARLIALEIEEKRMDLSEGQYLLGFCNNVSPMFCTSYGILYAMGLRRVAPMLFLIYGSALLYGVLTRPSRTDSTFIKSKKKTPKSENLFQLIDVCIIDSFYILIKLCGFLILFSIISKAIFLFLPKGDYINVAIGCLLELTNGLSLASKLPLSALRAGYCIAALTFGGICCILQTNSVIGATGLSLKLYVQQKIHIMLLALFLFCLNLFFQLFFNTFCR